MAGSIAHVKTPAHLFAAALLALALAGCGGGESGTTVSAPVTGSVPGSGGSAAQSCSLLDQKLWLREHFRTQYLWAGLSSNPPPGGSEESLEAYFQSLLFTGNADFPRDRFSGFGSLSAFTQYYDEGEELGYGLAVAGQEIFGQPDQPLYIRYLEPNGPAARAGLARGDRVLEINGVSAAERLVSRDFNALVAAAEGDRLSLVVERAGVGRWSLSLTASVYSLAPVQFARQLRTPQGRRVGYVYLHSFTQQARDPLYSTLAGWVSGGLEELIVDLRYNSGGLVEVSRFVGALVGSSRTVGKVFAELRHSAANARLNETYRFDDPLGWAGLKRVYVLTGMRTCSASEQLVTGLRGAGIEVVTVGGTTCGKPVGFTPKPYCDQIFSVVSFESVNALGQGRYFDGLAPSCAATDKPVRGFAQEDESLIAVALEHVDTGQCAQRGALPRSASEAAPSRDFMRQTGLLPPLD